MSINDKTISSKAARQRRPKGKDDLPIFESIRARQPHLTASEKVIAGYLRAHIQDVPFLTGTTIATAVGVSPMTVSRFLRSLGYGGLVAVKQELREASSDSANFLRAQGTSWLERCLEAETKALAEAYALAATDSFGRAADAITRSASVFVSGFQSVRGVAADFVQRLEIARGEVRFLDGGNGTYVELFEAGLRPPVLVVVDIQRYSKQARLLAENAKKAGIDLIVVADKSCTWARRSTDLTFLIETNVGTFWESNAPITSFLNLLTDAVIGRLGDEVGRRVARLHDLQGQFDAFND